MERVAMRNNEIKGIAKNWQMVAIGARGKTILYDTPMNGSRIPRLSYK